MKAEKKDWKKWLNWWRRAPRFTRFLYFRVRLARVYRAAERYQILFWAVLVGILGGFSSVVFRTLLDLLSLALTGRGGDTVAVFSGLPAWQRVLTPAIGGIIAGMIIYLGGKFASGRKNTTDYMEAVVLGEGSLSIRSSLVKILSSMASITSGASIGREGPMVQLASILASIPGRLWRLSMSQRRLILACGAAAGISSAYNAPIAGSLFVAEIVLGSIAVETLGPLLLASVLATQTVRFLTGGAPLYDIPPFRLHSGLELIDYLVLGLLIGLVAPWFLRALRGSEKLFARIRIPVYLRIGLGGLIVGLIAVRFPEVCGNGYSVVDGVLQQKWLWSTLAVVVALKLLATCASFGSGAVGGVFTPTMFMGASIAYLFGHAHNALGFGPTPSPGAFALAGMGMFLAATTHAPLMAILMVFEMTLDYQLILPLMLGCVVAYVTAHAIEPRSVYSDSLKRKGADIFAFRLARLRVSDLMDPDPIQVSEETSFDEIARLFIVNTFRYLYVVDERGVYLGAVSLDDIKEYLGASLLTDLVIARDILSPGPPSVAVSSSLEEALEKFTVKGARLERLPVVSEGPVPRLLGSVTKTDLLLALAERLPTKED
ncbi:MAG: ClcB-like voltage-gated chloride channel protein [Spirochaetes bacterium]|nr:ClcB-like voltage-gated chloride channel protein [Spirochaetota bacterium]